MKKILGFIAMSALALTSGCTVYPVQTAYVPVAPQPQEGYYYQPGYYAAYPQYGYGYGGYGYAQPAYENRAANALGGAVVGAGLGAAIGAISHGHAGKGAAIGALAGGTLGALR